MIPRWPDYCVVLQLFRRSWALANFHNEYFVIVYSQQVRNIQRRNAEFNEYSFKLKIIFRSRHLFKFLQR